MNKIKVKAPCSSANLGSGFDVFGLALEAFHDTLTAEIVDADIGITVEYKGLGAEGIPTALERNTAGLVAKTLVANRHVAIKILVEKGIPLKMGLGSSGATAAACAVALNELLGLGLSKNEVVKAAAMGEVAAAGASHADNVAASVLGGFTIVQSWGDELYVARLDPPRNLEVALALPLIETPENKTAKARAVLPRSVGFTDAVANARNAASVVAGFHLGDVEMIGRGMTDLIVEPARKQLIPGFDSVKKAAFNAGAAGVAISGAGPAVIAVVDSAKKSTANVASAMKEAFETEGVKCQARCTKPSLTGVVKA
ncbi:MAG: homoserine kinase [Candidatus Bathyarchaeia archaeon]|nr:homoserine kinase [Candidatus Bathyarchaeota archaeon]